MSNVTVAARIAELLIARKQTLAVSESSAGGLISAALLAVPGASAFYRGGGVIYTGVAGKVLRCRRLPRRTMLIVAMTI